MTPTNIQGSWGVAEWIFVLGITLAIAGAWLNVMLRLATKRQRLDGHDKDLATLTKGIADLTRHVEHHQQEIAVLKARGEDDRLWRERVEGKLDRLHELLSQPNTRRRTNRAGS